MLHCTRSVGNPGCQSCHHYWKFIKSQFTTKKIAAFTLFELKIKWLAEKKKLGGIRVPTLKRKCCSLRSQLLKDETFRLNFQTLFRCKGLLLEGYCVCCFRAWLLISYHPRVAQWANILRNWLKTELQSNRHGGAFTFWFFRFSAPAPQLIVLTACLFIRVIKRILPNCRIPRIYFALLAKCFHWKTKANHLSLRKLA